MTIRICNECGILLGNFTSVYQSEILHAVCIPSKLRNSTGMQPVNPQMRAGRSIPPPANAKYINCYNFRCDCPILTYLVCLDSEERTTGYANVYVSCKIINSVRNGACSQTLGCVRIF